MKIYKISMLAMALLTVGSCKKDFLNVEDLTSVTEQNFYKTPADGFNALVGCYDGLQRASNGGQAFVMTSEILSDNAFGGTGNADGLGLQMVDEFDKLRSPADANLLEGNWKDAYAAIYRCNMLIDKISQIEWGTNTTLKATYESEAKFLRAYIYFDMVRLFGNIPLITTSTKENVPQSNPDDVYKLIASDLKFAAENLPDVAYTSQSAADRGRVTRWAAKSMIARVYLYYTGYYSKPDLVGEVTQAQALSHLENVITSSGHGLVSNFANLWPVSGINYAGEDNKETVFGIKYTFTSDWGANTDSNHWLVMNGIRGLTFPPYGNGWGSTTVSPKLWNLYEAADTRKTATIISIVGENIPFGATQKADQREYTGYTNKKYTPMANEDGTSTTVGKGIGNFMRSQYQDYVSIRYSDVLLMAAELNSPSAQLYLNSVRERAGLTSLPITKSNILAERRLEFAMEGIRYWDLLRQGISTAAAAIAETTTVLNGGVSVTKTISASKVIDTKGLQQIPNSQITLSNGVLMQNQGW